MFIPTQTKRGQAFTLIELLVVISIIAVLASLLLPALTDARRRTKALVCLGNMRQMQQATSMYADENDGALPSPSQPLAVGVFEWYKQLDTMAKGYGTGDSSLVICNESKATYTAGPYRVYGWASGGNAGAVHIRLASIRNPSAAICLFEAKETVGVPGWGVPSGSSVLNVDFRHVSGNANFTFFDGHSERLTLGKASTGSLWSYP